MGHTITEKILARAAGLDTVRPRENHQMRPDYMIAYDFPGYTDVMFRQMRDDFGITFNSVLESGGLALGNKVQVTLEVEAVRRNG